MFHDARPALRNIVMSAASNASNVYRLVRGGALCVEANIAVSMTLDVMLRT